MLSTQLFDALADEHALGGRERLLLQVAALLHDIGVFVSLRSHHKHSQYLLAASQIFGLVRHRNRRSWPTSRGTTGARCRRKATCPTCRSMRPIG